MTKEDGTHEEKEHSTNFLQPILIAVCIAAISFVGGAIYQHERELLGVNKQLSVLRMTVYRHEKRDLEYRYRFIVALRQLIQLRVDLSNGDISTTDKANLKYLDDLVEVVREEKENFIEENKHRGE